MKKFGVTTAHQIDKHYAWISCKKVDATQNISFCNGVKVIFP